MKLITHSQRSWKQLFRCGATAACLSVVLAGHAQTSGSSSGSSASSNDRTDSTYANANRNNDKSAKADQKFIRKMTEASQREMAIAQLGVERATNPQVKAFAQKIVTDHQTLDREFASVTGAAGGMSATTAMRSSSGSMDTSSSASTTSSTAGAGTSGTSADTARNPSSTSGTGTVPGSGKTGDMAASSGSSGARSATGTTASDEYSRDYSAMNRSGSQDRAVRKLMDEKSGEDFDKAFVKAMVKEHKEAEDLLEDAAKDKDHSEHIRSFANKNLPTIRAHLAEAKQLEKSLD